MATVHGTNTAETIDAADGVTNSGDSIYGYNGNDAIFGLDGNDTVTGGAGADTIDGGAGSMDYVRYRDSTSGVFVTLYSGLGAHGTAEGDRYSNVEGVIGSDLDDTLIGSDVRNALMGSDGHDTLKGLGGDDSLWGGSGGDTLRGGAGADDLHGELGYDTASYADSNTAVFVSLANGTAFGGHAAGDTFDSIEHLTGSGYDDWLTGDAGYNVLDGGNGNDFLSAGAGGNLLRGGAGNDAMEGGTGGDTFYGGSGIDTVSYAGSSSAVIVSLTSNSASGGHAWGDLYDGVENLTGSVYADTLDGNGAANVLRGLESADILRGHGGADELWGGSGSDLLDGGAGNDTLRGGQYSDTYYVDGADIIVEFLGQGDDWVFTSVSYALAAHLEYLTVTDLSSTAAVNLTGNDLDNQLTGNAGRNVLDGAGGADVMSGGRGDDTYRVDAGFDFIWEEYGQGHDLVYATVNHTLFDHVEELSLNVGTAVRGTGNALDNTIYGNAGDNVLDGRDGADQLSGIGGNDTFVFRAGEASGDVVYAFEGNGAGLGDSLRFEGFGGAAAGASLTLISGSDYLVSSADGLRHEVITVYGSVSADDVVFV